MSKKFKVGDRVVAVKDTKTVGMVGTVVAVHAYNYDVIWDGLNTGHSGDACDGSYNHWYVIEQSIEPYCEVKKSTTKYNVGDVVTVRNDLDYWSIYHMADGSNPMEMTDQMLTKRGKKVKIKSITKTGKYMIEGSIFPWVDEMFEEKVETKPKTTENTVKKSPKFKVGDKVRVRNDLKTGKTYYMNDGEAGDSVVCDMLEMKGKITTIKEISPYGKYRIEGNWWSWTDEMFEPDVVVEEKREPKVGDRIKMVRDWCNAKKGMVGTIIHINDVIVGMTFDVRFDKPFVGGHTCGGQCEDGYGHNVCRHHFELLNEDTTPRLVCQVTFEKGSQMYSYLTEDASITVGSKVTVPCGKGDHEATATVQRIGYYTEADTPYPFDKMKKVVGKHNTTSTSTFDWDEFKANKIIVKLDSREKWIEFMKKCDEQGLRWFCGQRASDTDYWAEYKEETTVVHNFKGQNGLSYGYVSYDIKAMPDARVYDYKLDETKPKLYNGKVVCTNHGNVPSDLTVGKIYTFDKGRCENDLGGQITHRPVESVDDLNSLFARAKFIEIKE